jgi:hypothetical protein
MRALAILLTGALAASVAACGAAARRDVFMETVQTYNDGVRWERFTAAAVAVPPAERDQFLDEREELAEDLRITEVDIVRVANHGDRADIQVKMSWYLDSQGTVNATWVRQRWERQGSAWRVVDERRVRGDRMPGLAEEPVDDADDAGAAASAASVPPTAAEPGAPLSD